MALIPTRLDKIFREKVSNLRAELSKKHTVFAVLLTKTYCPNCQWDATNRASSGEYKPGGPQAFDGRECPICGNVGKVESEKRIRLVATVSLADDKAGDALTIQGNLPAGTMKLKTDPKDLQTIERAAYFLVDKLKYSRVSSEVKTTGLLTPATERIYIKREE